MKIKKTIIVVIIVAILLACLSFWRGKLFGFSKPDAMPANVAEAASQPASDQPINMQYDEGSLFMSQIKHAQIKPAGDVITGLIVPHHLLAKDLMANAFAFASAGQYQTIVLLSPDHYQAGQTDVSVTERDFSSVFGVIENDKNISRQLKKLSFVSEADFFYREHGLQTQLPFIKHYFPKAKLVAITFKPTVSRTELDQLVTTLEKYLPQQSLIIQSTDFSHYLTPDQAAIRDSETITAIGGQDRTGILRLKQPDNLDSVAALYVQSNLQKDFFKSRPSILAHKNSQDYTSQVVSSSTSYLTFAYHSAKTSSSSGDGISTAGNAKFIFVGDIMLSRHIGELMAKRRDYIFPFKLVTSSLTGADLVFGNLESPISDGGKSAGRLYSFRADPLAISGLKAAGFTVLSVANNHAFDYGLEAFTDTLANLKAAGLVYAGGGSNFAEAHRGAYQEVNGIKTTILAYTDLLPKSQAAGKRQAGYAYLDEAQLAKDIKAAKQKSDLVIVSFHWGREYENQSNERQRKIADAAVKAGASLIIGHHPHVTQEISELRGVPVAYSLGNFIFDQNFSAGTKKGLILEVDIKNKKIVDVK